MTSFKLNLCEAKTDKDILDCYPLIKEVLIPYLNLDEQTFLYRIRRQREYRKFRLMFIRDENQNIDAILGFRVEQYLKTGFTLIIDNMATSARARGKGLGHFLMEWAINYAKGLNCEQISLNSQYMRTEGHRFYLNHNFVLDGHKFVRDI